jgi:hypothetical protein
MTPKLQNKKTMLYIVSVKNVQGITKFDEYRPNCRHLTLKVDRNGFWLAGSLCREDGSSKDILSNLWHRRIGKCIPALQLLKNSDRMMRVGYNVR